MNEITIIIADDHPIVRQGLRQTIEAENGLNIVSEAEDGASGARGNRQVSAADCGFGY